MADPTRVLASLALVAAFAGSALAAETGMLYVKSDPPGAIVTIGGETRGKTPVLVRDLPPGEVAVELSLAGAEPVVKTATVEANRVVSVDVSIDVPSASLTVISDPLEAAVILDTRDAGKTPVTLEGLAAGPHQLILLKPGFPRTARTVRLTPGETRVLEVKLGTAGKPEDGGPPPVQKVKPPAEERVPAEAQLILTVVRQAVEKGNFPETRKNLELALAQPEMAEFEAELRAAVEVVRALESRQDVMIRAAEGLVGKDVSLRTKTGVRKGRVEDALQEGIILVSKIMTGGRAAGETRATIKWSSLHPDESERLAASWKAEGPDAEVARGFLALARKDEAEVARVAAVAEDHLLGQYLGGGGAAATDPGEEDPKEAWARIEKRTRATRMTATEEVALDKEIRAFKERHDKAGLDSSLRRRMSLAGTRAKQASGLVAHWAFDEGRGAVARDSSGRGNHGRIRGGARWTEGKIGAALSFGGTGFVDVGSGVTDFGAADFTIAAWIRTSTDGGVILSKSDNDGKWEDHEKKVYITRRSGPDDFWTAQVSSGSLYFVGHSCGYITGSQRVTDDVWHHVAVTWDSRNSVSNVYVDGVARGGVPAPRGCEYSYSNRADNPRDRIRIGFGPGGESTTSFVGLIDDVRIYNRALSAEEVKALAAAGE